jgi:hypothetical protein
MDCDLIPATKNFISCPIAKSISKQRHNLRRSKLLLPRTRRSSDPPLIQSGPNACEVPGQQFMHQPDGIVSDACENMGDGLPVRVRDDGRRLGRARERTQGAGTGPHFGL